MVSKNQFNPNCKITNGPDRRGDIRNSLANIDAISKDLNYEAKYTFHQGIEEYLL